MASRKIKQDVEIKSLQERLEEKLSCYCGVTPHDASNEQMYKAEALTVLDDLLEKKKMFNRQVRDTKAKRVYYLCMEFLVGRSLKTNLYNLGLVDQYDKILKSYGMNLEDLYEQEPDAGLGNGGLGRLAACFMDSLAALSYPATGFSITRFLLQPLSTFLISVLWWNANSPALAITDKSNLSLFL